MALGQDLAGEASVNLYFLADLQRVTARFGDRGYRAAELEGGIRGGRVYLAAYATGSGGHGADFPRRRRDRILLAPRGRQIGHVPRGRGPAGPALRRFLNGVSGVEPMASKLVTVFGGSGFLGRRIVERLAAAGNDVRVGVRHPDRAAFLRRLDADGRIELVQADVWDEATVTRAVEGAASVINTVGPLCRKRGHDIRQDPRRGSPARRPADEAGRRPTADPYLRPGRRSRVGPRVMSVPGGSERASSRRPSMTSRSCVPA